MGTKSVLGFTASFVIASAILAQGSSAPKPAPVTPTIVPSADMKWVDISADAPGVKIADLFGDHTKGAFGALNKFPAGFSAPLHTHTHAMRLVIVSGTLFHGPEGKPETRLGPGSYLMQPGNYRHTTRCDKASDCVVFIESSGKFDILPVAPAAKAPAKK